MKLRRLKHILLRLSTEEKVLGIGALMVLVGAFLPWYAVTFNFEEKNILESGFSGHLGVVGFVIFLLTLLSATYLIAEHISLKIPKFGLKKEQVIMFLMGESAFLILLMVAINIKRSLEYTNAELRFGLYISLIGSFIGAFAAYSQIQKDQKKDIEAFFGQTEEVVNNETDINEEKLAHVEKPIAETNNVIEDPIEQVEQKSFFYEENTETENNNPQENTEIPEVTNKLEDDEDEAYQAISEESNPQEVEQVDEDEMVEETSPEVTDEPGQEEEESSTDSDTEEVLPEAEEETEEEPKEETEKPTEEEISNDDKSSQADYFIREAGVTKNSEDQAKKEKKSDIKVDMESVKKVEPEKKETEPASENLSIYDDL